jgi:hypothetical protein
MTLTNAPADGASVVVTFPALTGYVGLSTAALTLAEMDVLDDAVAGTQAAGKAVIADSNVNIGVVKATELHIGATGSETQVTATPAQLNTLAGSSAGIAALLAGGLGGSAAYAKTTNTTAELVAAHATKARAVLVVAVVTESFADGDGGQPTFTVGEADTLNKFFDTAAFTGAAAGTVLVAAGTNTATKNISVTGVQATGTGAGAINVTVIAIPTT